jgi:hypothetical protein
MSANPAAAICAQEARRRPGTIETMVAISHASVAAPQAISSLAAVSGSKTCRYRDTVDQHAPMITAELTA